MSERAENASWYVVHTYSGYENKVKANLEKAVENRGMQDRILEIKVPMEDTIEIKNGKAGAVFIAHRAGAPIIPFAVYTKRKNKLRLFCKYTAIFGDPITVEELGVVTGSSSEYRHATRKLMQIIKDLQDECAAARSRKIRKEKEKELRGRAS